MFRAICAITLFACAAICAPAQAADFASHFIVLEPPKDSPTFSFEDAGGHTLSLKDFRGRYVLLNMWATWCAPCVREVPALNTLQGLMAPSRFTIIALTENSSGLAAATNFYSRHDIKKLPVYADSFGTALSLFHVRGLPISFLIDPQGREIGYVEGEANWAAPDAVAFLTKRISP